MQYPLYELLLKLYDKTHSDVSHEPNSEVIQSVYNDMYNALLSKRINAKSDEGLAFVSTYCKYLMVLDLSGCQILDEVKINQLSSTCSFLCVLELSQAHNITDACVISIAQNCSRLIHLSIDQTHVTDVGIEALAKNVSLNHLSMENCSITNNVNKSLAMMTNLRSLDVSCCSNLSVLDFFPRVTTLGQLYLSYCMALTQLVGLTECTNIFFIHANYVPAMTNKLLCTMAVTMTNLETLHIDGTLVEDEALELFLNHPKIITLSARDTETSAMMQQKLTYRYSNYLRAHLPYQ